MAENTDSRSDLYWVNEVAKRATGHGFSFDFFNKKVLVDLDLIQERCSRKKSDFGLFSTPKPLISLGSNFRFLTFYETIKFKPLFFTEIGGEGLIWIL